MADYKAIKGLGIQTFSGDHPNAASGDVWYNATLGKLRVHKLGAGAWSSGANLPTARYIKTSFGTTTAAIYVGGAQPPDSALQNEVLKYNGTAWSEEADFPHAGDSGSGAGGLQPTWLGPSAREREWTCVWE